MGHVLVIGSKILQVENLMKQIKMLEQENEPGCGVRPPLPPGYPTPTCENPVQKGRLTKLGLTDMEENIVPFLCNGLVPSSRL